MAYTPTPKFLRYQPPGPSKVISVKQSDQDLWLRIQARCFREGVSASAAVSLALWEWMKDAPEMDDSQLPIETSSRLSYNL